MQATHAHAAHQGTAGFVWGNFQIYRIIHAWLTPLE